MLFKAVLPSLAVALLGACTDVVEETDISYDARYTSTRMDRYAPSSGSELRPAVLVVHGGSWRTGLGGERDAMTDHAKRLAGAGYVTFNISYRLVGSDGIESGVFPAAVQDVLCALSFIRGHAADYGVDADRIGALGYSAGGHIVSLLGVAADADAIQPDCDAGPTGPVQAVISGAGVQDMFALPDVSIVEEFLGGDRDDIPDVYRAASPVSYVTQGAPPFLFIHGKDDWFVSFDQTLDMRDELVAVGTPARILSVPGGGHLWSRSASGDAYDLSFGIDSPSAWAASLDFLDRTIGPTP